LAPRGVDIGAGCGGSGLAAALLDAFAHLIQTGGLGGPEGLDGGVELSPDHHGEADEEREQQIGDRAGERAVGVARAGDPAEVHPQDGRGDDEEHRGKQGPGD